VIVVLGFGKDAFEEIAMAKLQDGLEILTNHSKGALRKQKIQRQLPTIPSKSTEPSTENINPTTQHRSIK